MHAGDLPRHLTFLDQFAGRRRLPRVHGSLQLSKCAFMRAESVAAGIGLVATLGIAISGCGDASRQEPANTGGTTSSGGVDPLGGAGSSSGTGGSATSSGGVDPGAGGTTGGGGSAALGGGPQTGGASSGGDSSGGGDAGGTGSQASTGGQAGSGGQPPSGGGPTGGVADTGGTATTGGQATGGSADTGGVPGTGGESAGGRPIWFGTLLDPRAVIAEAQELAQSLADPDSPGWQATGDQHRTYHFPATGTEEPYRLYVPTNWDGQSDLPLVMFLHGAGSNENTYVDQNNGQLLTLAQQHGFLLVSAMGDEGAYGNFLRLSAPFGNEGVAADLMDQVTDESERTNELSEQDVINVLELVLAEYPIDRTSMFLTGHSMGSGGTWYIGGKYASYWRGLAPMSGPFVQETGYPWEDVRSLSILVTEGTQTPSLDASRLLANWLEQNGFDAEYQEVDADHGAMVPLVLPAVFDFFDRARVH